MSARLAVGRMLAGPEEWSRRRLQILFGVACVVSVAVVVGIVWTVVALFQGGSSTSPEGGASGAAHRPRSGGSDLPLSAAQPGPLSTKSVATIRLPQPATVGPAEVGTGLPHSSGGAMAQLVAIDQRAIGSGSVVTAEDVITAWAAPGGPTAASWSGVAAVQTLLQSAGLPANGSDELTIQLYPEMGLVHGSTDDATTACVDFVLSATVPDGQPNRIAVADCQHMIWRDGRWMIAPGPEAEPTPSLWPGTQASYDAGYEWLEVQS